MRTDAAGRFKGGRGREYGLDAIEPLTKIWENSDRLSGKRLEKGLAGTLESLERRGEIELAKELQPPPSFRGARKNA